MTNELYKTKKEIESWLNQYEIKNYELIEDKEYGFVVNVNDSVRLTSYKIKNIPIKFNIVLGLFNAGYNEIEDLSFCPIKISGGLYLQHNKIKNLEKITKDIGGVINLSHNQIESLKGIQDSVFDLDCSSNNLKSLKYSPKNILGFFKCSYNEIDDLSNDIEIIKGFFDISFNKIKNLKNLPKKILENVYIEGNKDLSYLPKLFSFNQKNEVIKKEISRDLLKKLTLEIKSEINSKKIKV